MKLKFAAKATVAGRQPHDLSEHAKHLYHTAGEKSVIDQE